MSAGSPWAVPAMCVCTGAIALAVGLHAQQLLLGPNPAVPNATRWYIGAAGILIIGWWGTDRNESLLPVSFARVALSRSVHFAMIVRAILLNLIALFLIFSSGPNVAIGVAAWCASIGLFVYACRPRQSGDVPRHASAGTEMRWHLARRVEVLVFLAILTIAVILRLWRLGDLAPGMHGDEGEAGADALGILNGNVVSPFERGWATQSNVYYWTLAAFMRVFGTGLVGLRSFAVACGLVTVVFVYFLARDLFGQRCAIIAAAFLSFQSADLIFSRQQFSNDTVPMFLACMAYLLVRGFRSRRHADFALAGAASGLALYYYAGGRLVAPTALLILGYVALTQRTFLRRYWTHVSAFALCLLLTAGPFLVYNYWIAPIQGVGYPNDRFIWYHQAELAAQYGVSGWPAILWNQLTRTLSILTYTYDGSAMQASRFPIARPIESVLLVLGISWSLVRWRDTRFALLSIWFWSSIVFGGVLTDEAPDLPRIVGILGVMPLFMAVILDHLSGQMQALVRAQRAIQSARWAGAVAGTAVAMFPVAVAGAANWQTYTGEYMKDGGNQVVSLQAQYVHNRGPKYYYYDLGAYFPKIVTLYWAHGNNRFLNPTAAGEDVTDLGTALPVVDNGPTGEQDVVFLVWTFSPRYHDVIHTLRRYYPHGRERVDRELLLPGQAPILVTYTISHREIDTERGLLERYVFADGRRGSMFDRAQTLARLHAPFGARYPVRLTWNGMLAAPVAGTYKFRAVGAPGSTVTLDGHTIGRMDRSSSVLITRGAHVLRLAATLPNARSFVGLRWVPPIALQGAGSEPVPRRYVWSGMAP